MSQSDFSLYLVPTPIGNLDDITYRAVMVLQEVDVVLAEDTRKTGILLKHLGLQCRLQSYHAHNEHHTTDKWIAEMQAGRRLALVSDAGTPGLSDPGFLLTRACQAAGLRVSCLPGATALIPALVCSGLPTDRFVFEGFLPHKKGRQTRLNALAEETRTIALYESPHRLLKTLAQLAELFGQERRAAAIREISKIHEQTLVGTLAELATHFTAHTPKGEFVLIIEGKK